MSRDAPVTIDDLQAFADKALPPGRRAEVAAFLEENAEAASYVERVTQQNAALREAAAPYLDRQVPPTLRVAALMERDRRSSFRSAERSETSRAKARPQIAAALVAGLVLGGLGGWGLHPSGIAFREGVRPLAEEAADAYAVYEPDRLHPVEIAANDKVSLMRWATERLGRSISAPDTIGDYTLLGGRVVATSRGPAAMFMYQGPGAKRLVLMICPLSLHGTAPLTASVQGDLDAVSWSDRGIGYSLVGPQTEEALKRLGETVRLQAADKI